MRPDERLQLSKEFLNTITLNADQVLAVSDRIQHYHKTRAELTALCKFGRSMQVRRLKTVAPKHWNGTDWMAARAILDEIASLQKQPPSTAVVLALAVLGVTDDTLDDALAVLEQRELAAVPVTAEPQLTRPERQSGQGKKK